MDFGLTCNLARSLVPSSVLQKLLATAFTMAGRAAAYQQSGESQTSTLDALSKRLSDDLRQHIRSLGSFPLLSKDWVSGLCARPISGRHGPHTARAQHCFTATLPRRAWAPGLCSAVHPVHGWSSGLTCSVSSIDGGHGQPETYFRDCCNGAAAAQEGRAGTTLTQPWACRLPVAPQPNTGRLQDSMTLWDKDDMAVRMVLEEGKLNMCLRVLQEYKAMTRGDGALQRAASVSCGALVRRAV